MYYMCVLYYIVIMKCPPNRNLKPLFGTELLDLFILEAHSKGLSIHKLGATASASAQDAMAKLSSGPMVLPDLPGAKKRSPTGKDWSMDGILLWVMLCHVMSCYML